MEECLLIDSDVLIDYLRGHPAAIKLFGKFDRKTNCFSNETLQNFTPEFVKAMNAKH